RHLVRRDARGGAEGRREGAGGVGAPRDVARYRRALSRHLPVRRYRRRLRRRLAREPRLTDAAAGGGPGAARRPCQTPVTGGNWCQTPFSKQTLCSGETPFRTPFRKKRRNKGV